MADGDQLQNLMILFSWIVRRSVKVPHSGRRRRRLLKGETTLPNAAGICRPACSLGVGAFAEGDREVAAIIVALS